MSIQCLHSTCHCICNGMDTVFVIDINNNNPFPVINHRSLDIITIYKRIDSYMYIHKSFFSACTAQTLHCKSKTLYLKASFINFKKLS